LCNRHVGDVGQPGRQQPYRPNDIVAVDVNLATVGAIAALHLSVVSDIYRQIIESGEVANYSRFVVQKVVVFRQASLEYLCFVEKVCDAATPPSSSWPPTAILCWTDDRSGRSSFHKHSRREWGEAQWLYRRYLSRRFFIVRII
jgi:hypothetical protein